MKTKTDSAGALEETKGSEAAAPIPIGITDEEEMEIKECAAKTGQPVDHFIRKAVLGRCAKLNDKALVAIPCPFCKSTDSLEVLPWISERKDGTEYDGDAVKCTRCDSITPVASWARLGNPRV